MAQNFSYPGSPQFSPHGQSQNTVPPWSPGPSQSPIFYDEFSPQPSPYPATQNKPFIQPLAQEYGPRDHKARGMFAYLPTAVYNWWFCVLSVLVSVCAMAAIILLLFFVQNKTLPKLPLSITVNTYVSFFSTIAKGTMLVAVNESISQLKWLWFREPRLLRDMQVFDDASRGPIGAARLIFRTNGVRLAALGGLVVVVSLLMDPFTQQIVSYPSRSVQAGTASVGRALAYDAGIALNTLDGGRLLTGCEYGMKAAIYDGLFKPKSVTDLQPVCPTGNCTFPLFDSLAVCSKCLNVTDSVIINEPVANPDELDGVQLISYSLPGGEVEFSVLFSEGTLAMGPELVATTVLPPDLPSEVLGVQNPFLTLAILQFPNVQLQIKNGNYYNAPPVTHECALYFCINTYNVTVQNSNATTQVVSTWTSDTGTPTVGGALQPGGMEGTQDAVFQRPPDKQQENDTYYVAAGSLANLQAWLNVTVQGSINTSFSEVDDPQWLSDELLILNATTDWMFLMHKLAMAMTTYIRDPTQVQLQHANQVLGVAYRFETYIHVAWIWLTLPVALVGISIVFLTATIIDNESKRALAWKSSSLALLFHGLEGVGRARGGEGMLQMRRVARRTKVVLSRGYSGEWKLVNRGTGL